jgi:hypothetical protein
MSRCIVKIMNIKKVKMPNFRWREFQNKHSGVTKRYILTSTSMPLSIGRNHIKGDTKFEKPTTFLSEQG